MSSISKNKSKAKRRESAPGRNGVLADKASAETIVSAATVQKDVVGSTGHRDVYGLIPASPPSHVDGDRNKRVIMSMTNTTTPSNDSVLAASAKNARLSSSDTTTSRTTTPLMDQEFQKQKKRVVIDGISNISHPSRTGAGEVIDDNNRNAAPLPTIADRRSRTTPLLLASSVTSNTSMTDETALNINHNLLAPFSPSSPPTTTPPLPPLGPTPARTGRSNKSGSPSDTSSPPISATDRDQRDKQLSLPSSSTLKARVASSAGGGSTTELAHAALHGTKVPPPPPKLASPLPVSAPASAASTPADRRREQLPPPMTGIFYKRRDVFQKQWRPRFFVLNPLTGMLSYYLLPSVPWPATSSVVSSGATSTAGRQRTYTEESQLTTSSLGSKTSKKKERHANNRRKNGSPRKRKNVRLEASLNASNQRAQAALALQNTGKTKSMDVLPLSPPPLSGESRNNSSNDTTFLMNASGDNNNVGLPVSSSSSLADGQLDVELDNDSSNNVETSNIPAIAGPPRGSIFLPGCHVYANDEKTKTLQQRFDAGRYVTANHDSFDTYGKAGRRSGRKQRRGRNKEQQKRQRLSSTDSGGMPSGGVQGNGVSMRNDDDDAMDLDHDDSGGTVERYPYTYVLTIAVIPPTTSSSINQSGGAQPGSPNSTNTTNPSAYTGQHLAAKTKEERDRWVKALKAVSNWMDPSSSHPSPLPSKDGAVTPSRTSTSTAIPEEPTPVETSDDSGEDESEYDDEDEEDDEDDETQEGEDADVGMTEEDDGYERDADGDDVNAMVLDRSGAVVSGVEDNDDVLGAGSLGLEELTKEDIVKKFASVFDDEAKGESTPGSSDVPSYFEGVPEELRQVIETKVDQLLTVTGHKVSKPTSPKQPSPWKTILQDDKVVAKMRPYEHNDKLFTVRVDATIGGQSAEERITMGQLVDCLLHGSKWTKRTKPDLTTSKIVKVFNAHTYVMHECVRAVWPTTARDYLLVVHWRVLPETKQIIVCGFSHPFPDICPPNPRTHVRADIVQGGNILTPLSTSFDMDKNDNGEFMHCPIKFQRVVTMDLKGSIPNPILQLAQKKLAEFPTVVEQALLEHNKKSSSPCPSRLAMPISSNEDILACCIWYIPELRKGALAINSSATSLAQLPRRIPPSSQESKERDGKRRGLFAGFKSRLATRLWALSFVLVQAALSLLCVYHLVFKSRPLFESLWSAGKVPLNGLSADDNVEYTSIEGTKRICTFWIVIVLWISGVASTAGREPKSTTTSTAPRDLTNLLETVQLRVQQRKTRLVVPILLLLPPLLWFSLIRQVLTPDSVLWQTLDGNILVTYYAKDLKSSTSQQMMELLISLIVQFQSLVVSFSVLISPMHQIVLCLFTTWYIVRWFVSRRFRPASSVQDTASSMHYVARTGQVTCRFQVDVKGALRYIGHQKELQQEELAKAKKRQKKRLKAGANSSNSELDTEPYSAAKVVITHIVVKAVALALQETPELISKEDNNELVLPWLRLRGIPAKTDSSVSSSISSVKMDIATGFTPGGSKFVSIDDANSISVRQIASETKRLVDDQKKQEEQVGMKSIFGRLKATNTEPCSLFERFVDRVLIRYLGFKDPTIPSKGAALVMTSPNSEHNHVEMDVTPASSSTMQSIAYTSLSLPSIVVVVGGVRISRDTKTGVSRPMIGISIGFDMDRYSSFNNADGAHPGQCRKLAERVQRLLTFPELCDVPPTPTSTDEQ